MNDEKPNCGDCKKVMTPENSTTAPEYFLCDECAPKHGFPRRPKISLRHQPGGVIEVLLDDWVYVQVNYNYRYTNNAQRMALAERIATLLL